MSESPNTPARPGPNMPPRTTSAPTATRAAGPSRGPGRVAMARLDEITRVGVRVALYGTGGIGKTTLAAIAPGPVAFFDLDESLPRLRPMLAGLDVRPVRGITDFQSIRDALASDGWDGIQTIVIDTVTRAEELAVAHTLKTVPISAERSNVFPKSIEGYGYGKGFQYVYDTFLPLLADLDRHAAAGRNVVLVCHECTTTVPNPRGDDWLRYEPRLQNPSSGKASIRLRVKEWVDHLLFVGFDVEVNDGIGKGNGTRTVYPCERPWCMAKSRTLADKDIPLVLRSPELWAALTE